MEYLLRYLYAHARFDPEAPAIMLADRVITYGMLIRGVLMVERRLAGLPLDRDHVVGLLIESPARHIIVALALMKRGLAFAPLSPDDARDAERVGMRHLLSDRRIVGGGAIVTHVVDDAWFTGDVDANRWDIVSQPDDRVVFVSFTSGSTGFKKAIGFTGPALKNRITDRPYDRWTAQQRALISYDSFSFSSFKLSFSLLAQGGTVVFDQSAEEAVRLITYLGVDYICGSNARLADMMARLPKGAAPLYSVRSIFFGGSRLTPRFHAALKTHFRARLFDGYGSTEAGTTAVASGAFLDDAVTQGLVRFLPLKQVRIVDSAGATVDGEGRVALRSDGLGFPFSGAMTQGADARGDGWFYPGDIGRIDSDGALTLTGRADDIINIGGVKFAPEILEETLRAEPSFADLAIITLEGNGGPELVVCYVAAQEVSLAATRALLKQPQMAEALRSVRRVDAIPRTATGKIARDTLRRMLGAGQS